MQTDLTGLTSEGNLRGANLDGAKLSQASLGAFLSGAIT